MRDVSGERNFAVALDHQRNYSIVCVDFIMIPTVKKRIVNNMPTHERAHAIINSACVWRRRHWLPEVISVAVSRHVAMIILFWAALHSVAKILFIVVLVPDSPDGGAYKYIHLDLGIYDMQFVVRLWRNVCVFACGIVWDCVERCALCLEPPNACTAADIATSQQIHYT